MDVVKRFRSLKFYWRTLGFRIFHNVRFGAGNRIDSGCNLSTKYGGRIEIGSDNEILFGVSLLTYGGKITIGHHCSINPFTIIYGHGHGVTIGNDVLIAGHCVIIPSNHNYQNSSTPIRLQGATSKGIVIENNVWIGANSTILDGVRISEGAVVAAGSVVNRDVTKNSLVGGVPARHLKFRNEN